MCTLKKRYFSTLEFTPDNASKREKALNRAYQLRTFEIEHYWKRANYFWGFQIVIFAAFGLIGKEIVNAPVRAASTEHLWNVVLVALSVLGALTAVANFLSARGSKFWQQNWERHIDMLEDDIEGRLHKTIWLTMTPFSVSRVNQTLSFFFILFWIVVTLCVACAPDFGISSLMITFAVIALGIVLLAYTGAGRNRSSGRRIPAGNLEGLVINRLRTFLAHDIAREEQVSAAYLYTLLRLPWLAPDITTAIINGRKPPQLSAQTLMRLTPRLPTNWAEQRKLLGFL
jgi:hypothetical protein